jgi:hypothetical protein
VTNPKPLRTVIAHVGQHRFIVRYPLGQEAEAWNTVRHWRRTMHKNGFSAHIFEEAYRMIYPSPEPPHSIIGFGP